MGLIDWLEPRFDLAEEKPKWLYPVLLIVIVAGGTAMSAYSIRFILAQLAN